jgi:tetratricopeptide (TPR) repeat protein
MRILLLLLALQASPGVAPSEQVRARRIIEAAVMAVDGDSVEAQRARWRSPAEAGDGYARLGLATLARETYRYAEADHHYTEILRAVGADGDLAAHAWLGIGLGKLIRWQTDSAAHAFEQVLRIAPEASAGLVTAEARLGLAAIAARTMSGDTTIALAESAGAQIRSDTDDLAVARIRCAQGAALRGGSVVRADSLVRAGLVRARAAQSNRAIGRCLLVLAQILEIRGLQADSRSAVDSALIALRSTRDMLGQAAALQFSAYAATTYSIGIRSGYRDAQDAAAIARAAGDEVTSAWATLNLAQIAQRVGDGVAARRHALAARATFERTNDRFGLSATDLIDASAHLAARRFDDASVSLRAALARNDSIGWHTSQPWTLFELAAAARGRGDIASADSLLDSAMARARSLGMRGWDVNEKYARGLNALARGDYVAAIEFFTSYLSAMSSWSRHYLLEGELRLAEAHARAGDLDTAEERLEQAFLHLGYVRGLQTDRDAELAALQSRQMDADADLGIATIVRLFGEAGRTETAFRIVEAQRARFLWTRLVRRRALVAAPADIEGGTISRLLPEALDLVTLYAAIPDSTALVEYVTGSGGEPSSAFVITRSGVRSLTLAPVDSLADEIRRFSSALEGGAGAGALGRTIGRAVLDPILAWLPANVSRLVLSPDGPLHRVPFDALVLPDGRRVMERFATSLTPSARLSLANWQGGDATRPTGAVILGDAHFDPDFGLPPLADSRTEAQTVARSVREPRLLLGQTASESALRAIDWDNVGLLHLATHARVEDDGVMSSALFVGAGDNMDGRISVADIAALPLKTDLVVLSSCRTLGGVIVTGEGLQGLTAPFLEAGARAVAATYWAVGDRSIQPLIERFYDHLRDGLSAGDALTRAKRESMEAGESPAVWASFSLTGDARVRPGVF